MKARLLWLLPVLVLLLAAGCQTVDTRIKEKPTAFASLDKATQDMIKHGAIGLGFTEDMVYLALGKPDQKRESLSASAHTLIWIYNSYSIHYDSAFMYSYYQPYYYGPYPLRYRPYYYPYPYHPYYADAYHSEVEERIRVTFNDGKVTAIDQLKE